MKCDRCDKETGKVDIYIEVYEFSEGGMDDLVDAAICYTCWTDIRNRIDRFLAGE